MWQHGAVSTEVVAQRQRKLVVVCVWSFKRIFRENDSKKLNFEMKIYERNSFHFANERKMLVIDEVKTKNFWK